MILAAFALACLSTHPALAPAQDPAAVKGLESVRKLMERRQWDKAYDALRALLAKHERDELLLREAESIRVDMSRIVFWRSHAEPEPAALVSGTLKQYKDGKIEIAYAGDNWDDWELHDNGFFSWAGTFAGPYTIVVRMQNHPSRKPFSLVLAAGEDTALRISFGLKDPLPEPGQSDDYFYPARLETIGDDGERELDTSETVLPLASRPAELKVQVTNAKVSTFLDGKKSMEAKRPKGDYGGVGFFAFASEADAMGTTLEISGEIEPMWLQNKADAAMESARAEFEEQYEELEHLPAWLTAPSVAPAAVAAEDAPPQRPYPGPELTGEHRDAYRLALDHLRYLGDEEGIEAQLEHVEELAAEGALSAAALEFLRLRCLQDSGRFAEAIAAAEHVILADPAHLDTRVRRARMLARLGKAREADAAWSETVAAIPGSVDAVVEYVFHLIERNEIGRAGEVARAAAFASSASAERLEWLRRVLLMADKGPAFERGYEITSEHYVVRSDISREICSETARLLESAYISYSVHLKRPPGAERNKFRVYVFAGEASYQRYADEAFGGRMESTAGVYSGLVKQLLIWNLPDADERRRTVIHEGFHQYLDSVTQEAPRWFNEGLAQYYELADTVNGKFTTGQVDARLLRRLTDDGIAPLEEFFRLDAAEFMEPETVARNYAQAWAFVHFLRHGGRPQLARFDALFRGLTDGLAADAAVHAAFAGADLAAMEAEFVEYLEGLAGK